MKGLETVKVAKETDRHIVHAVNLLGEFSMWALRRATPLERVEAVPMMSTGRDGYDAKLDVVTRKGNRMGLTPCTPLPFSKGFITKRN